MATPNTQRAKICGICAQDCSNRPRTRDDQGRYYCRACVERAKREHRSRVASASRSGSATPSQRDSRVAEDECQIQLHDVEAAPPPPPLPVIVDDPEEDAEDLTLCWSDAARIARNVLGGVPEFIAQPWVAFVVPAVMFGVLYAAARGGGDATAIYISLSLLFGFTITLLVYVLAFYEGLGTGLLTLCLPFYILYFVFAVNENPYVKAVYGAALLAVAAAPTLPLPEALTQGLVP